MKSQAAFRVIPETSAAEFAVTVDDAHIILTRKGEGYARLRLRHL